MVRREAGESGIGGILIITALPEKVTGIALAGNSLPSHGGYL